MQYFLKGQGCIQHKRIELPGRESRQIVLERIVKADAKGEQTAHAGTYRLGVEKIHTGADERHIFHPETEGSAQDGADISGIAGMMEDDMGV